jgi:hypothetical protein
MKRMWMALMLVPALAWAQQGWMYLGRDDDGAVYLVEVVKPKAGNPVAWAALEFDTPQDGARSGRIGHEFDCGRRTGRLVASTTFSGKALTGAVVGVRQAAGK